jgi:peroxisome-assembly ATPase
MSNTSLQAAYKVLLARQRLAANPRQAALVTSLASLQTDLTIPYGSPKGRYIYGSVGTGKSRIADLFASTLPSSISSRRIHFYEFMMDIHTRLHHARSQTSITGDPLLQIGKDVRNESRVLCFDEFQVTDIADALILRRLFGSIWEHGGVVVATSNRKPENLYENGLNRGLFLPFVGELRERCEIWTLEGKKDYRMRYETSERKVAVFFTDEERFRKSLVNATADVRMKSTVIPVLMSRQLRVLAVPGQDGKLVVSSNFENLCQNFLGPADYFALCKVSSSIYLTGLRKFKADELDFVRRFITLVDLAYEARIRIICLSSVPLFEVFLNIIPSRILVENQAQNDLKRIMTVKGEGGSSSSKMSTFIGEMEWSAVSFILVLLYRFINGSWEPMRYSVPA